MSPIPLFSTTFDGCRYESSNREFFHKEVNEKISQQTPYRCYKTPYKIQEGENKTCLRNMLLH
jgi:hypothetical protein